MIKAPVFCKHRTASIVHDSESVRVKKKVRYCPRGREERECRRGDVWALSHFESCTVLTGSTVVQLRSLRDGGEPEADQR
jgi:hypothetical protein